MFIVLYGDNREKKFEMDFGMHQTSYSFTHGPIKSAKQLNICNIKQKKN